MERVNKKSLVYSTISTIIISILLTTLSLVFNENFLFIPAQIFLLFVGFYFLYFIVFDSFGKENSFICQLTKEEKQFLNKKKNPRLFLFNQSFIFLIGLFLILAAITSVIFNFLLIPLVVLAGILYIVWYFVLIYNDFDLPFGAN